VSKRTDSNRQNQTEPVKVDIISKKNIFKDFTFWFALFSLGISLYTIFDSNYQLREQNKKWVAINSARISISNVKFFGWRKITFAELREPNWGYNPTATQYLDDPAFNPNDLVLPYKLVAVNRLTKQPLQATSSMKISDLKKEIVSGNLDTANFYFQKAYNVSL
jgi:hypothetical protein